MEEERGWTEDNLDLPKPKIFASNFRLESMVHVGVREGRCDLELSVAEEGRRRRVRDVIRCFYVKVEFFGVIHL